MDTPPAMSFDVVAETARRAKVRAARVYGSSRNAGRADLLHSATVVRGGVPTVTLVMEPTAEDGAAAVLFQACSMFRADEVFLVADGLTAHPVISTGRDFSGYSHGDMARDWHAGRRAGLSEAIIVSRFAPSSPPHLIVYPYRRKGEVIRWDERVEQPTEATMAGRMPDVAAQGFAAAERTARAYERARAEPTAASWSEEEWDLMMDRGAARAASEARGVGAVSVYRGRRDRPVALFRQGKEVSP